NGTSVAIIAEVRIDRRTGAITPVRYVCAHECGLIINPQGLMRTIECNIIQSASRALWEEVGFDPKGLMSVDWDTYPISDIKIAPAEVEIVLVENKSVPAA